AARHRIRTRAAVEGVVSAVAGQAVGAFAAVQNVRCSAADDRVVARAAEKGERSVIGAEDTAMLAAALGGGIDGQRRSRRQDSGREGELIVDRPAGSGVSEGAARAAEQHDPLYIADIVVGGRDSVVLEGDFVEPRSPVDLRSLFESALVEEAVAA